MRCWSTCFVLLASCLSNTYARCFVIRRTARAWCRTSKRSGLLAQAGTRANSLTLDKTGVIYFRPFVGLNYLDGLVATVATLHHVVFFKNSGCTCNISYQRMGPSHVCYIQGTPLVPQVHQEHVAYGPLVNEGLGSFSVWGRSE